jgi:hypothetical protein
LLLLIISSISIVAMKSFCVVIYSHTDS